MNEMIESVFDPLTTTKNFNEKKTIKIWKEMKISKNQIFL